MAEAKAYKMIPHCTFDTITYEMDELIRCKDCKFFISEGHYCKIRGIGRPLKPDDFCSDGRSVK